MLYFLVLPADPVICFRALDSGFVLIRSFSAFQFAFRAFHSFFTFRVLALCYSLLCGNLVSFRLIFFSAFACFFFFCFRVIFLITRFFLLVYTHFPCFHTLYIFLYFPLFCIFLASLLISHFPSTFSTPFSPFRLFS